VDGFLLGTAAPSPSVNLRGRDLMSDTDGMTDKAAGLSRRELERSRLGRSMRALRLARGLKLIEVAAAAGVSPSLLSQVERGQLDPSLDSLRNIADALGTTSFRLLSDGGPALGLVRRGEAKRLPLRGTNGDFGLDPDPSLQGAFEELLSPSLDGAFELTRWELPAGEAFSAEPRSHRGEEATYLVEGQVRMELGGEIITLSAGDCITFDARVPHRVVSMGETAAVAIVVLSPPTRTPESGRTKRPR
jgi:mannose-6-phosphate isomerase-like protein (cupin superfamily)/DNA-binding XRE family transcriptional regulator